MRNAKRTLQLLILASAMLLTACGSGDAVDTGDSSTENVSTPPDRSNYVSISVTENGEARPLVDGTEILLHFDGARIGASAGCNLIGGNFEAADTGELTVSDLSMTGRGCPDPALHEQDTFVADFLSMGPLFELLPDDSIRLSAGGIVVEFVDEAVANPPLPLLGTQWEVTGFFDVSVANSFNVGTPAWIQLGDDSTVVGFDGCQDFTMDIEVRDTSLEFASILDDPPSDCVHAPYAARVSASIRGASSYVIEADQLTLTASDGTGITFRAR